MFYLLSIKISFSLTYKIIDDKLLLDNNYPFKFCLSSRQNSINLNIDDEN